MNVLKSIISFIFNPFGYVIKGDFPEKVSEKSSRVSGLVIAVIIAILISAGVFYLYYFI